MGSDESVAAVRQKGRIGCDTAQRKDGIRVVSCLLDHLPARRIGGILIRFRQPAGNFQCDFFRSVTILTDHYDMAIFGDRENIDPCPAVDYVEGKNLAGPRRFRTDTVNGKNCVIGEMTAVDYLPGLRLCCHNLSLFSLINGMTGVLLLE